jgi:hypothetical protein
VACWMGVLHCLLCLVEEGRLQVSCLFALCVDSLLLVLLTSCRRPAGLCVPGRKSGHAEFVGSAPAPSAPSFAEMEDF